MSEKTFSIDNNGDLVITEGETKVESTKRKKYYKVGEQVWLKEEKKVATIKSLDKATFDAVIVVEGENNDRIVKFWQITKLRKKHVDKINKPTRPAKKDRKRDVVKFAKVRKDGVIPSKRAEDGGYDVYASLEGIKEISAKGENKNFIYDAVFISPHTIELIPTGIASAFSSKYRAILKERGSTGTKGLAQRCGVIDSGYRNEWFVPINNTTDKTIVITSLTDKVAVYDDRVEYPITKAICQANLQFVPVVDVEEISFEELKTIPSERGMGKLGASGK